MKSNPAKSINLRQVAKLAGTSKSTVSRVLTNHPSVSPETRARIEAVIERHKFRPNLFARALAGGKTGLVAVLASEMNSGFFAEVIKGIDEMAGQNQSHLLSSFAHGPDDYIRLWREFARRGRADGLILIAPPLDIFNHKIMSEDIPVVLCAARAAPALGQWSQVDSVCVDNRKGLDQLLSHLAERGCKRFAHLAGPPDIFDAADRRQEFEHFFAVHPELQSEVIQAHLTRDSGRNAVEQYLQAHPGPPDVFVAVNDLCAFGALEALKARNLNVPRDVAVTGCDDDIAAVILGLTTLRMPMVEIGRQSGRFLFDRINSQRTPPATARQATLQLDLCVRASTP